VATDPLSTAVFGDGVLSLGFPDDLTQTGTTQMPMDPTIEKTMDQNFVNNNRRMDEAGQRHVSSAAFIDQQAQMSFMLSQQLVSAKAAGQLDRDSLAKSRLDAAAVGNPVVLKTT
jgi:hypothetical protein